MYVNGAVWEAVEQSDLTHVTPAHRDRTERSHRTQRAATNLLQSTCSTASFFGSGFCMLGWAHLSLSRARG